MNPERLAFIDETGATTRMARRHGRAQRGERLVMAVPHGHKVKGIAEAIAARGAELDYLPPYSPDLNALLSEVEGPIDQLFAKLKALLRKAAARSLDLLRDTIDRLLDAFAPAECQNYLRNSGYVQPTRDGL